MLKNYIIQQILIYKLKMILCMDDLCELYKYLSVKIIVTIQIITESNIKIFPKLLNVCLNIHIMMNWR